MYRLTILEGSLAGQSFAIGQGDFVIGSAEGSDLRLPDPGIAARHASILVKDDDVILLNESADHPVRVHDHPVKVHHLHHGDILIVGSLRALFHRIEPPPAATEKRVISLVQIGAVLMALVVLAIQVSFLVGFPLWQRAISQRPPVDITEEPEVEAVVVEAPPSEPVEEVPTSSAPAWISELMSGGIPDEDPGDDAAAGQREASIADTNLYAQVFALMEQAEVLISEAGLEEAGERYEQIMTLAPEFLPAFIEYARLLELRGLPEEAAALWQDIRGRTQRELLREQADREVSRLTEAAVAAKTGEPPAPRLAGRLRIADVERTRFQSSPEYDEMRLLQISLRARAGEDAMSLDDVRLYVEFYDRLDDGSLVDTTSKTSANPQNIKGPWAIGETLRVTASYVTPPGLRSREEAEGKSRSYGGYRIYVYYQGVLQDETAAPLSLLQKPMFKPF